MTRTQGKKALVQACTNTQTGLTFNLLFVATVVRSVSLPVPRSLNSLLAFENSNGRQNKILGDSLK